MQDKKDVIAASILSANLLSLGKELERILEAGVDWIHFDVMDNHFVPNLSFGPDLCREIRKADINVPIDVHLMIKPVDQMISIFAKAGATRISFHTEASEDLDKTLKLIRDEGCLAGVAFNPANPLQNLSQLIQKIDLILLMSVNPGFAGQKFIPSVLTKLKEAKVLIDNMNPAVRLEIDGGVNLDNVSEIKKAGADTFVIGSALFGKPDYKTAVEAFRERINNQ